MKGHPIRYSAEEMAWLEAHHALPIGDYHAQYRAAFDRDVSAAALHGLRIRKGWRTGRTGRFAKGSVPTNKGKSRPFNANSAATQFKPGHRGGKALEKYKPIGTERVSKEGYPERKIHDGMPFQSRWRAVHLIRWEALNGPVPKGMALKNLDGDRTNTDPSNFDLIPRSLLPRLNGGHHGRGGKTLVAYDEAPPELRPAILTTAKLANLARVARARGAA